MKYVKCINEKGYPELNEDSIYIVLNQKEDRYLVCKDTGSCYYFPQDRFVDVEVIQGHRDDCGPNGTLPDTPYTPSHYKKGIETWDYTDSWGMDFLEGNIIKYITRWKNKGGIDDLRKALMYLQRLLRREEKKNEGERNL